MKRQSLKKAAVLISIPLFGMLVDKDYPFSGIHRKIGKLLKFHGVKHLDLQNPYFGIPVKRLQVWPGVDRHPNEIAHRIAAEQIYL